MAEKINIKLSVPEGLKAIYTHLFEVFSFHFSIQIILDDSSSSKVVAGSDNADVKLSYSALKAMDRADFDWLRNNFTKSGFKIEGTDEVDHVTSALYMLNYLQEYGVSDYDDLGRYPYDQSYQKRFQCIKQDLVSLHFKSIAKLLELRVEEEEKPSRIFVSHDIDEVNTAYLENGFYALKKGRIDILLKLVFNQIIGNPEWLNMSEIMDVNDEYGIKSTFFWLVNQKKVRIGKYKLRNADYSINDPKLRKVMQLVSTRNFENGLHKGIAEESFSSELQTLDTAVIANRNHFLKIQLPNHFEELDSAGLKLDFSSGFAEQYGFRNSYARPVRPFNFEKNESTEALCVPLHMMDTTNWIYKKQSLKEMEIELLSFIDSNKHNAVLSLLWHNKYFSGLKFQGYLELYKTILEYSVNANIRGITQNEILDNFTYNHSV